MQEWPVEDISQIYGIEIKECHSKDKILFIDSSIGPLAVKRSTLTPEELQLQYSVLCYLLSEGYSQFAKIVPTQKGDGFAHIGANLYQITTWISGTHPNFGKHEDLELAVKTLAEFHRSARGYKGPAFWQKRRLYGAWPARFSYRLSHIQWYKRCIKGRGIEDEFDQIFVEQVDNVLAQGYRVIEQLNKPFYHDLANRAREQGTVCHHDVAYHNIIIDEDEHTWLIDFDYCLLDMHIHDLSNMVSRHVKYTNWRVEDISSILLMYHYQKPLLPAELKALLCLMEFPQDFWQIAWAKYNELGMHKADSLLLRLKKFVETQQERQQVLAEFTELVRKKNLLPGRETL